MSRGDLAEKQERERADWRQRGIAGTVTAVDAARQEVTVRLRGQGEAATVVIATGARPAVLRRYAPDSVKFADARPAALEEIQVGDQVRALGERGADGARFTAEQVVSGAFRTVVGVVEAVDASAGEVRLAAGAEKLLVRVAPATALRRLPRETAAQLAAPRSGGGASNLGEMLERLPALALTELKAGDRLAVSSTRGSDPSRINAVAVVAGIEPLLAPPQPGRPGGAVLMPGLPAGALDMGMGN
jgi:hypothetical protein